MASVISALIHGGYPGDTYQLIGTIWSFGSATSVDLFPMIDLTKWESETEKT